MYFLLSGHEILARGTEEEMKKELDDLVGLCAEYGGAKHPDIRVEERTG